MRLSKIVSRRLCRLGAQVILLPPMNVLYTFNTTLTRLTTTPLHITKYRFFQLTRVTYFGTNPLFITMCMTCNPILTLSIRTRRLLRIRTINIRNTRELMLAYSQRTPPPRVFRRFTPFPPINDSRPRAFNGTIRIRPSDFTFTRHP